MSEFGRVLREYPAGDPREAQVYCLCIDLVGSTRSGLRLSSGDSRRFYEALAEQITPHLRKTGLHGAVVKFTGDGWLVLTDSSRARCLCAFAILMARTFDRQMRKRLGRPDFRIPALRLSIASALDFHLAVLDRTDWVGDSARLAVRLNGYCRDNEVLVTSTVREAACRDFELRVLRLDQRPAPPKPLEDPSVPVYALLGFSRSLERDPAPGPCYSHVLREIGRRGDGAPVAPLPFDGDAEPADKSAWLRRWSVQRSRKLLAALFL